jgi:hypothetical protein
MSSARIAYTRKEAAELLGVSVDTIKVAQARGDLRAKNTKFDANGRPVGITLYSHDDLRAWFDGLGDA